MDSKMVGAAPSFQSLPELGLIEGFERYQSDKATLAIVNWTMMASGRGLTQH